MPPPPVFESIYESLLSATSEVVDYVSDVGALGIDYVSGIKDTISRKRNEDCETCSKPTEICKLVQPKESDESNSRHEKSYPTETNDVVCRDVPYNPYPTAENSEICQINVQPCDCEPAPCNPAGWTPPGDQYDERDSLVYDNDGEEFNSPETNLIFDSVFPCNSDINSNPDNQCPPFETKNPLLQEGPSPFAFGCPTPPTTFLQPDIPSFSPPDTRSYSNIPIECSQLLQPTETQCQTEANLNDKQIPVSNFVKLCAPSAPNPPPQPEPCTSSFVKSCSPSAPSPPSPPSPPLPTQQIVCKTKNEPNFKTIAPPLPCPCPPQQPEKIKVCPLPEQAKVKECPKPMQPSTSQQFVKKCPPPTNQIEDKVKSCPQVPPKVKNTCSPNDPSKTHSAAMPSVKPCSPNSYGQISSQQQMKPQNPQVYYATVSIPLAAGQQQQQTQQLAQRSSQKIVCCGTEVMPPQSKKQVTKTGQPNYVKQEMPARNMPKKIVCYGEEVMKPQAPKQQRQNLVQPSQDKLSQQKRPDQQPFVQQNFQGVIQHGQIPKSNAARQYQNQMQQGQNQMQQGQNQMQLGQNQMQQGQNQMQQGQNQLQQGQNQMQQGQSQMQQARFQTGKQYNQQKVLNNTQYDQLSEQYKQQVSSQSLSQMPTKKPAHPSGVAAGIRPYASSQQPQTPVMQKQAGIPIQQLPAANGPAPANVKMPAKTPPTAPTDGLYPQGVECPPLPCPIPKVMTCGDMAMATAASAKASSLNNGGITRSAVLSALRSPGGNFIRIGGLSGFTAVAMGAYAAHVFYEQESESEGNDEQHKKEVFNIANRYHFIHSIALLATPLFRCPLFTGTLLTLGIIVFCGSCYVHALTGNQEVRRATPYGGVLLIAAWLSMLL